MLCGEDYPRKVVNSMHYFSPLPNYRSVLGDVQIGMNMLKVHKEKKMNLPLNAQSIIYLPKVAKIIANIHITAQQLHPFSFCSPFSSNRSLPG